MKNVMRRSRIALGVSAAISASAFAQQGSAPQETPAPQLPTVTVTATLAEQDTRTAPASVTIISREELETRNAADLLDAVRGTQGITLSPRQVGGRRTLALRGLEGKHTLTLIDGRRISPTDDVVGHSDYQYGWLPMSAIERIEVIRGPMSSLYGSEALGGVINLITRQPTGRWTGAVSASAHAAHRGGGDGGHAAVFAAGPVGERFALRLNSEFARTSAVPGKDDTRLSEIEGRESRSGGVGGTFKLTGQQSLEANWSGVREERFYQDVAGATAYENRYDIERSHAHLTWRGEFHGWRGQARVYRSEVDITNSRTNSVASTRPQNLRDEVVDGFAAFKLGSHALTAGGELRRETLKNAGLRGGQDDATHQALFVQDEVTFGRSVMLTAGVRVDRHQIFGTEASPRAYLVWEATPELVVKGGFGHAFKAPTLKQISPNYVGAEGPHTFLGNANIKPEAADSLEIGADWRRGPLSLRATVFHTEVEDLITYRLLRVAGTRRTYQYDNLNQARFTGLETGLGWTVAPGFAWNTDLTLLRTKDKTTGKELADRPETTLASRLDWRGGDGWSARIGLEYTGRQQDATGVRLPGYTLWNASVGKRFGTHYSVRAGVDNLTDLRLAEKSPNFGHAERSRTFFLNVKVEL